MVANGLIHSLLQCAHRTGYGGTPMTSGTGALDEQGKPYGLGRFAAEKLIPFYGDASKKERRIKVTFNADCSDALPWKFTPLQKSVVVRPGESALAFYTAKNRSDKDIIGIATYNVTPNNVSRKGLSDVQIHRRQFQASQ
jgi:hypothetical protein